MPRFLICKDPNYCAGSELIRYRYPVTRIRINICVKKNFSTNIHVVVVKNYILKSGFVKIKTIE